jgi:hypothetical protein
MAVEPRLASHVQVSALVRQTNISGDFAVILHKGDMTSGAILVIGLVRGSNPLIFEKFPSINGGSDWCQSSQNKPLSPDDVRYIVEKRILRDPDLWVIELDTADDERLTGLLGLSN